MRRKVKEIYRDVAEEFAHRVTSALGGQIDSMVLYGSVARGEAKRDSDIDILVISPNPDITRDKIGRSFTSLDNLAPPL